METKNNIDNQSHEAGLNLSLFFHDIIIYNELLEVIRRKIRCQSTRLGLYSPAITQCQTTHFSMYHDTI